MHLRTQGRLWRIGAVCALLLISFTLRWSTIGKKAQISHDEGISYLVATCHRADWGANAYQATPTPVSEWRRYFDVENSLCFDEITQGLESSDIHPPLYFWILHLWSLLFGVSVLTGPMLNMFLAAMSLALLFRLSRLLFTRTRYSLLVTYTYALSLSAIIISTEARNYDLLTLLTLSFIGLAVAASDSDRQVRPVVYPALSLIAAVGLLTHLNFVYVVCGVLIMIFVRLVRRDRRRLAGLLACILIGAFAARLVFPIEVLLGNGQSRLDGAFTVDEFWRRTMITAASFLQSGYLFVMLAIVGTIALVARLAGKRPDIAWPTDGKSTGDLIAVYFFCLFCAVAIVPYVLIITPGQAMDAKYLALVWPFAAMLPVVALRWARDRGTIELYFYLLPLVMAIALLASPAKPAPGVLLADAKTMVIDSPARGIFSQIIFIAPEEAQLIVGDQAFLAETHAQWTQYLDSSTLYVSDNTYANTESGRGRLLAIMRDAGFEPTLLGGLPIQSVSGTQVYSLRPVGTNEINGGSSDAVD